MARAKKRPKLDDSVAPPQLGVVSNLFGGGPEEVANLILEYELEAVQILPSFPGIRFPDAAAVTTAACQKIGKPFIDARLTIAGVSAHTNFVDPDRRRRKKMIQRFDALVEHCKDFGASHVVTETGTLNPDHPWEDFSENHTTAALEAFLEAIAPSVRLAEKLGVTILLEGYVNHVISTGKIAASVRERLGESVGFIMDPANFFTKGMVVSSKKHLKTLFEEIGANAPVAHGKDVRVVGAQVATPRAGSGAMDYYEFLTLLSEYQPGAPLILEQLRPEELRETVDFIDRFFP